MLALLARGAQKDVGAAVDQNDRVHTQRGHDIAVRGAQRLNPVRRGAYTVDGSPAATFGSSHRVGTSSNGANDRLAKWTSTPRSHNASANGSPAYTSNPPPAP